MTGPYVGKKVPLDQYAHKYAYCIVLLELNTYWAMSDINHKNETQRSKVNVATGPNSKKK